MSYHHKQEEAHSGAPTPERAAIANGSLVTFPIYENPNSRVVIATGYRIATPIYKMFQDGRISENEQKAAEIFYRDYTIGMMSPGLIAKYGERMGFGGTPLAQQANTERLTPEERRAEHHTKYVKACSYIGHKPTAYWLTAIACEIPVGEPAKVPTLEDVGRIYGGYKCPKRAQSSGSTLIKSGLERLTDFYGLER
jgi:hypothetical protein